MQTTVRHFEYTLFCTAVELVGKLGASRGALVKFATEDGRVTLHMHYADAAFTPRVGDVRVVVIEEA